MKFISHKNHGAQGKSSDEDTESKLIYDNDSDEYVEDTGIKLG
jgi:hypothetical protein